MARPDFYNSFFFFFAQYFYFPLRATLEVVVKPDSGQSGPRERLMEQFIASTCDSLILTKRHPHTAISIVLQVEKDGGAVSHNSVPENFNWDGGVIVFCSNFVVYYSFPALDFPHPGLSYIRLPIEFRSALHFEIHTMHTHK